MAVTSGLVENIYVNDIWGCVNLTTTSGTSILLLWSYLSDTPTAEERILHNQWLAMTRDAFASGKTVEVFHDDGSALATGMRIE